MRHRVKMLFFFTFSDLGGGNTVHKADLLKSFLAHGQTNLPPLIDSLIHHLQCYPRLVQFVLNIQIHIATESIDLRGKKEKIQVNFTGNICD